jgi:hypothetical protein
MHSELLPPPTLPVTSNSMDIPLSSAMHPSYSPHAWSEDWEVAGPEAMIRLCEVQVKFTGEGWRTYSEKILLLLAKLFGRMHIRASAAAISAFRPRFTPTLRS